MHTNGLRRQPQSETDSLVACKLQGAACKLQGAACKLQGAACKLQGVACELQGAACKLQGAACELQGALANECPKVPPLLYMPWLLPPIMLPSKAHTCSSSYVLSLPASAAGRRHLPRLGRLELSLHVFPTLCLPICACLSICSLLTGSLLVGPPFAVLLSPVDPVWAFGSR